MEKTDQAIRDIIENITGKYEEYAQYSEIVIKYCASKFEPFAAKTEWIYFAKYWNSYIDDELFVQGYGPTAVAAVSDLGKRLVALEILDEAYLPS